MFHTHTVMQQAQVRLWSSPVVGIRAPRTVQVKDKAHLNHISLVPPNVGGQRAFLGNVCRNDDSVNLHFKANRLLYAFVTCTNVGPNFHGAIDDKVSVQSVCKALSKKSDGR